MLSARIMRQLWTIIDSMQVSTLLQFDDAALVQLLLNQFAAEQSIDAQATHNLNTYLQSRLPLIRDIAEEKRAVRQGIH
jgi:hypothetical protein